MSPVIFPPALGQGGAIVVVAPSGPFDARLLGAGLARLAGFRTELSPKMVGRQVGFLAGDDLARRRELQRALDSSDVGAILVARGGYGLGRIVDTLDWKGLLRHPKWLCGFSDATVLHQRLLENGLASIHGPNGTTLAGAEAGDVEALVGLLTGATAPAVSQLRTLCPGKASGPLVGGNLTVLFAEAAAGRLRFPDGSLLFLEDVTETSYRVDRMLSSLTRGGLLEPLAGIVLGGFDDCSAGKFGVPTDRVLEEFVLGLGLPAVGGFPAGHGRHQHPFVHGQTHELDATAGVLRPIVD